jgi:hypothetical protein
MELSISCLNPQWVNKENFLLRCCTILGNSDTDIMPTIGAKPLNGNRCPITPIKYFETQLSIIIEPDAFISPYNQRASVFFVVILLSNEIAIIDIKVYD